MLKSRDLWQRVKSLRDSEDILQPYIEATGLTPTDLPTLFRLSFWRKRYGREPWAQIASVMLELKGALDRDDASRAEALCDTVKTLRHNTDFLVPTTQAKWNREKWPEICP